jgi:hypothetical protein
VIDFIGSSRARFLSLVADLISTEAAGLIWCEWNFSFHGQFDQKISTGFITNLVSKLRHVFGCLLDGATYKCKNLEWITHLFDVINACF